MAAEVLGMLYTPGVNQQPVRVLNGTPTTFGNVIPVAPDDPTNDALNFPTGAHAGVGARLGNDFYILVHQDGTGSALNRVGSIYVYDPSTGNWVTTGNGFTPNVGDRAICNLKVGLNASGVPRVFATQTRSSSASTGGVIYRDLDGPAGWIQSTPVLIAPGVNLMNTNQSTGILYRNILHGGLGGRLLATDPIALSFSVQAYGTPSSSYGRMIFGVVQGRLFALVATDYNSSAIAADSLLEFTGSWLERWNGLSPGIVNNQSADAAFGRTSAGGATKTERLNSRRAVIFEDPATRVMVILFYEQFAAGVSDTTRGLRAFSVDLNTFVPTEITPTVAPAGIAFPTGPDMFTTDIVVDMVINYDTNTDPANPVATIGILLAGGSYTWYQWNGVGSAMTNVGGGQTVLTNITHVDSNGGGENIYEGSSTAVPALYVHEVGRVALEGESQIQLQGFAFDETGGTPSTPSRDVELLYSRTFGGSPTSPARNKCTLSAVGKVSGPGATPTLSGGNVTAMDFDNGATTVFANWEAINDGLFKGEQHNLMPRVLP